MPKERKKGKFDRYCCEPINYRTGKFFSEYITGFAVFEKIKILTSYITGFAVCEKIRTTPQHVREGQNQTQNHVTSHHTRTSLSFEWDRRRSDTVGPCVVKFQWTCGLVACSPKTPSGSGTCEDVFAGDDAPYALCLPIDDNPEMSGTMDQEDSNNCDEAQSKRRKLMDELELDIPELKTWF